MEGLLCTRRGIRRGRARVSGRRHRGAAHPLHRRARELLGRQPDPVDGEEGRMSPRTATSFGVGHTVSRLTAARVLADVELPADRDPGRRRPLRPGRRRRVDRPRHGRRPADHAAQFDHGVVRVLNLEAAAKTMSTLHTSTTGARRCPSASASSRWCARSAHGPTSPRLRRWEPWPNDTLLRANLASEAYQLGAPVLLGAPARPRPRPPSRAPCHVHAAAAGRARFALRYAAPLRVGRHLARIRSRCSATTCPAASTARASSGG